ncbi:MAG: DUF1844 domain-containing protein [Pedosphaera sp.]|nr:DUF1844 domain-containing protein [Pedosphaera sp.]
MADRAGECGSPGEISREEMMSALFANLVVQQTNMAFVLLGRISHAETGKLMQDLETARLFIDQLEMLAVKTRGNLKREEDQLLQQSLMNLRMIFVEAVEQQDKRSAPKESLGSPEGILQPATAGDGDGANSSTDATAIDAETEESKKRFTKNY